MKSITQMYGSMALYVMRLGSRPVLIALGVLEGCGILLLLAKIPFWSLERWILCLTLAIFFIVSLFQFLQEYRHGRTVFENAKESQVNPLSACRAFLYEEAVRQGRHMRDPKVYRKVRIYFTERILTRTLLQTEG